MVDSRSASEDPATGTAGLTPGTGSAAPAPKGHLVSGLVTTSADGVATDPVYFAHEHLDAMTPNQYLTVRRLPANPPWEACGTRHPASRG